MKKNTSLIPFALVTLLSAVVSQAQLTVDTSSREQSRTFFNAVYPSSSGIPASWTGNVANGGAGTTSAAFQSATFRRVNFFRAFAGVPAGVTNNSIWSSMNQSAALMMSANNNLSHEPPKTWRFYSVNGATAAGKSDIALGNFGPAAINAYMEDPGSFNAAAGHRRWILYPQTQQMGTGDIPPNSTFNAANALWVQDTPHLWDPRPDVRDGFVAWPPRGYVPYQVVYPRWSFSYPNADFSQATVSVTLNSISIPVAVESPTNGYGENTLVFIPGNVNPNAWAGPVKPASDLTYVVNISNVITDTGGLAQNFSYTVNVIDPAKAGSDSPDYLISGPAGAKIKTPNSYQIPAQVLANGYQWKYSTRILYTRVAGAEIAGDVLASVPAGYAFRDSRIRASGKFSYHLAHPRFLESSFAMPTSLLCTPTTVLSFASRLSYATSNETACVEVSADGGSQWVAVWSQRGTNNAGQSGFVKRSISLAAFNGREIKVRFRYALGTGSAYTQTNPGVGWNVDNISFTAANQLNNTVYSAILPTTEFPFSPTIAQTYVLQARASLTGGYFREWTAAKIVTATP